MSGEPEIVLPKDDGSRFWTVFLPMLITLVLLGAFFYTLGLKHPESTSVPLYIPSLPNDVIYSAGTSGMPFTPPFTTLKVGIYTYKVGWLNREIWCGANTAIGCTSLTDKSITVRYDVDPMYLRSTILHEVQHAINNLYSNHAEDVKFNDEEWAETSPLILQVLRDNPPLTKFLLEDVK